MAALAMLVALQSAAGQSSPARDPLQTLADDPSTLRSSAIRRDFGGADRTALAELMRNIAADSTQDWDVRARALTLLSGQGEDQKAVESFSRDFELLTVAEDPWGADTCEILAEWASRFVFGETTAGPLLLPPTRLETVALALNTLAGNPIHHYLRYLDEHGYRFPPVTVSALAETDDQLTRQFLCWWVGEHRPQGMAAFLLSQINSPRESSYRSQVDRVFLALFTAGLAELIRSAVPTPRWLQDDATPKGLALESLARYYPPGVTIPDPAAVTTLLAAATENASGKDRGQWQLAVDILFFLAERDQLQEGPTAEAAADLVRQVLRKRGPLEPFVAVAELNRTAGLPFPDLSADERSRVWEVASKTLDAAFLTAVVDHLPDEQQRELLEQRLLGLGGQAARGTLRVVRCWGADIETPGDWAAAVAGLRLVAAIDDVEGVLDSAWPEQAVEALIRFDAAGASALGRFLHTERSRQLDSDLRVKAVESCALHLPEDEWNALLDHLEGDPAFAATRIHTNP